MNRDHFYFKNPKYSTNHICIPRGDNTFGVYEKMVIEHRGKRINLPWWRMIFATPLASGETAEAALKEAVKLGIKPYDVEIIDEGVKQ